MLASSFGDDDSIEKAVDKLVEKNVPLDAKDEHGASALHYAVANCMVLVTKFFSHLSPIEYKYFLELRDKNGRTCLHLSALHNQVRSGYHCHDHDKLATRLTAWWCM